MFTVSRLAKSSILVLLAATLTVAAHARDGGGGGERHNGSSGPSGPSVQVHGNPMQSDARIVSGNGSPPLSKGPVGHGVPVKTSSVRDHRDTSWPDEQVPNTHNNYCANGCVGEGGGSSGQVPGPGNSYKPRDGQVNDHRSGEAGQVRDHRGPAVTIKFP